MSANMKEKAAEAMEKMKAGTKVLSETRFTHLFNKLLSYFRKSIFRKICSENRRDSKN